MDMSKLHPICSRAHIITIVEKGSLYGGEVWQADPYTVEGRRVSPIIQIHNDLKFDRVVFRTPTITAIDPDAPVFVRLNYRNLIFRLLPGEFKVSGDKIACFYPESARALEERKGGDRYVLPFNAEISLSLKRIERTMREMTYEMELRIVDVSEKGFGIIISSHNRDYLKTYDHFWLKSIDHSSLRAPILGNVCYVAPRGYFLKRGDVRVGLSLSMPLAKETLEYLKRKCFMVLPA